MLDQVNWGRGSQLLGQLALVLDLLGTGLSLEYGSFISIYNHSLFRHCCMGSVSCEVTDILDSHRSKDPPMNVACEGNRLYGPYVNLMLVI